MAAEHLRQELSPHEWQEVFEKPPTPKILSLAELIEKAQKQAEEQRKAFISRNAVTDPGILSWQLDELLRLMPLEITLTEVRQNYLQGPMHPGKALVFAENTLLLSGRTGNAASLSLWIQQISALPWVESSTMNGFSATGTQAKFSLELHINSSQPKP